MTVRPGSTTEDTATSDTQWTFLGAGNMAASLVGGLIAAGTRNSAINLVDPNESARSAVTRRFGVDSYAQFADVPAAPSGQRHGLVVAVKPNIVEAACRAVAEQPSPPLVVSVAAGVRLEALASWLPKGSAICRCMPNTPALLGLGATGLYAHPACTTEDVARAEQLLGTAGYVVRVPEEHLLDAVTATSGSGPAYIFQFVEHMASAGTALGLAPDVARDLAIETAFGAASMLRARETTPDELRRRVTSKGGTTAAALASFNAADLETVVHAAVRAANDRAVELGDEFASGDHQVTTAGRQGPG